MYVNNVNLCLILFPARLLTILIKVLKTSVTTFQYKYPLT